MEIRKESDSGKDPQISLRREIYLLEQVGICRIDLNGPQRFASTVVKRSCGSHAATLR